MSFGREEGRWTASSCRPRHQVSGLLTITVVLVMLALGACSGPEPVIRLENPEWHLNGMPAPSSATPEELTVSILPQLATPVSSYHGCDKVGHWRFDTVGT